MEPKLWFLIEPSLSLCPHCDASLTAEVNGSTDQVKHRAHVAAGSASAT